MYCETDATHSGGRVSSIDFDESLLTKRVHPNVLHPSHNTYLSFTTHIDICLFIHFGKIFSEHHDEIKIK